MTGVSACRRVVRTKCYVVHSGEFADSGARPVLTPCQDEGMSSRTTGGYWKLGEIGCRGASCSKVLNDKELRGSPEAREDRSQDFPLFWTTSSLFARAPSFIDQRVWYTYFKGLCKRCFTAVMQTNNALYSSVYLSCFVRSRIGIYTRSLLSKRILSVK